MKKLVAMALWAGIAGLVACQSHEQVKIKVNRSSAPQNDTARAYQSYLQLKDELVKADGQAAQQAARQLAQPLTQINGCGDAAHMAGQIAATTDIKKQRAIFLTLSQDMIPLVKGFKGRKQPVYVQYCPMANQGKGGYWLSAQKEIKNPYYGKTMLDCGEVKEEVK